MEGSGKWLSPSKSTAIPKPSSTGENDENDSSQDKMIPKSHNPKKTTASKHFMSPTISAASKAAPPKKKILSERNENSSSSDVRSQRTSFPDRKNSPRSSIISHSDRHSSRIISPYDLASEFGDDVDTDFVDNSSVKAYDPVRNYLSPRPKYLRFNPNRRHEIFNRLEKEESDDSFDSQEVNDEEIKSSSVSPSKESVLNPEKENNMEGDGKSTCNNDHEEEEEDEEEIGEEGGLCFRELIKFLLTLIACVLSTAYICTMNFESPTPTQQAIWKVRDGYLSIKRHTLDVIDTKMHEAAFLKVGAGDGYVEFEDGGFETDDNEENKASTEVQIIEDGVENPKEVEIENPKVGDGYLSIKRHTLDVIDKKMHEAAFLKVGAGDGYVEFEDGGFETDDNKENKASKEVQISVENPKEVEIENPKVGDGYLSIKRHTLDVIGTKMHDAAFLKVGPGEASIEVQIIEDGVENPKEVEIDEGGNREIAEGIKFEGTGKGVEDLEGVDNVENEESVGLEIIEVGVENLDEVEIDKDVNQEIIEIVEVETVVENLEKVENESGISEYKMDRVEEAEGAQSGQYVVDESAKISKSEEAGKYEFDIEIKDMHEESTNSVHENEKTGQETSAFIGLSMLLSIILASLAVAVYRLRRTPRNASAEESEPVLKPHKLAAVDDKKRIEFIARPSLPLSIQETPRKLDHGICAPNVELIGEIVVGQARRRRIREHNGECEESNTGLLAKCGTLTQPVLASAQPSGHEYSDLSSSSYGSFTTETKILKKEGAQSGEGGMIEVTPVRRSSRLRSRAKFMSP
ncbi:hypothetical protein OROMI_004382 [Orobanche minor]